MSTPVVWSLDPHTGAKHTILVEYLKAWFPILSKKYSHIIYIDGFAGPGIYEKGEDGSPIIALNCLLSHSLDVCHRPTIYEFYFIEANGERKAMLEDRIKENVPGIPKNVVIHIIHGDFDTVMRELLDDIERKGLNLSPTFAFLDPFGYGGLPFDLIRRTLAFRSCEVFINFAYDSINRFIEAQDTREETFDKLFGTPDWRRIRDVNDAQERNTELTALYTAQLKTAAKYVRSFEMVNSMNKISYYLFFTTNSIDGFGMMKAAMWKVDPRGSFRFADTTDVGQRFLISYDEDSKFRSQADFIYKQFYGKTASKEEIKRYCIEFTPFPALWSTSLKILESEGKIVDVLDRKRKGTFPDGCRILFNQGLIPPN